MKGAEVAWVEAAKVRTGPNTVICIELKCSITKQHKSVLDVEGTRGVLA